MNTAWDREDLWRQTTISFGQVLTLNNLRLVHLSCSDGTSFVALVHERHHLLVAVHHELGQVLDVWTEARVFSHTEVARVLGVEKIAYFLVVNLQECQSEIFGMR